MTEKDWRLFNNVLLEIYYSENIRAFGEKLLDFIKLFIPYEQGYFIVVNEENCVDVECSVFRNIAPDMEKQFVEKYFAEDYLNDMCSFSKSMAYRDTDLMDDAKRIKSRIYQNFFRPQRLDMGCGLIIMKDGRARVLLDLLRRRGEPDVSDYEMEILQTFLSHVEKNVMAQLDSVSGCSAGRGGERQLEMENLSAREQEIVRLVYEGYSNQEIGSILGISPATVKKHLSNIYGKTGVSRRTQLFQKRR